MLQAGIQIDSATALTHGTASQRLWTPAGATPPGTPRAVSLGSSLVALTSVLSPEPAVLLSLWVYAMHLAVVVCAVPYASAKVLACRARTTVRPPHPQAQQ